MKIIPLTEEYKKQWDKIVYESDDAWMFHLYDWVIDINENVWGYKSLSFLIEDKNQVVGIFPLFLKEIKISRFINLNNLSSGFGTGGLALINGLRDNHRGKIQSFVFDYIDTLAKQYEVHTLEIILSTLAPTNLPPFNKKINPLLSYGFKDRSTDTHIIDLENNSYEDLLQKMEKRSRNAITKATKNNIEIKKAESIDDLRKYYELHCETYRRTKTRPHSFSYFETIFKKGWANMFFAYYKKNLIAAINLAVFKTGIVYWTSASDYEFHSVGANNFLQWHAIKWAKENGYHWYEVGETFLKTKNSKLAGLTRYKSSFGGEIYPFFKGEKVYRPISKKLLSLLRILNSQQIFKNIKILKNNK